MAESAVLNSTRRSLEHPRKTYCPIESNALKQWNVLSPMQPSNEYSPMVCMLLPPVTVVRLGQYWNMNLPIWVSDSGRAMLSSAEQLAKTNSPVLLTVAGSVIEDRLLQ